MDTDKLVAHARARFDHDTARRLRREKYEAKMLFNHEGGMWRAGPELLVLLESVKDLDQVVLADLYGTPVSVDRNTLFTLAKQRWQEQMLAWQAEHADAVNKR